MEMTSIETTSMKNRQLHSSQKEAMKKIAEFSGESSELDVDEWLFDLTNLFSLMKLKDETKILETMGKLTGPALRWYQENLTSFTSWNSAEKALRDRFKKFTSDSELMQEFFQIQQEENESITAFYENVIRKYRKVKKFITEKHRTFSPWTRSFCVMLPELIVVVLYLIGTGFAITLCLRTIITSKKIFSPFLFCYLSLMSNNHSCFLSL